MLDPVFSINFLPTFELYTKVKRIIASTAVAPTRLPMELAAQPPIKAARKVKTNIYYSWVFFKQP